MENGSIQDKRISASSEADAKWKAANGRLRFKRVHSRSGAWTAKLDIFSDYVAQWLQVDFGSTTTNITKIAIQGRAGNGAWVNSFTFSYSDDGKHFTSAYSSVNNDKVNTYLLLAECEVQVRGPKKGRENEDHNLPYELMALLIIPVLKR